MKELRLRKFERVVQKYRAIKVQGDYLKQLLHSVWASKSLGLVLEGILVILLQVQLLTTSFLKMQKISYPIWNCKGRKEGREGERERGNKKGRKKREKEKRRK